MDTINDRFRQIYKKSGLSQEAFAKAIKRGRGEIANIVYGKTEPKENVIDAVSEHFGIRKEWLLTGEGEMKEPRTREEEIADLVGQALNGSNDFKLAVVKMICSRTDKELEALEAALRNIYESL